MKKTKMFNSSPEYDKQQVQALREIIQKRDKDILGNISLLRGIDQDAKKCGLGDKLEDREILTNLVSDMHLQLIDYALKEELTKKTKKIKK